MRRIRHLLLQPLNVFSAPILFVLGLEEGLQTVAVIDLVEEVKLALRRYSQRPPQFAGSRVQCQLLVVIGLRHIRVEFIVRNRPSERFSAWYRVSMPYQPCMAPGLRLALPVRVF